jgi:hypothetical protein
MTSIVARTRQSVSLAFDRLPFADLPARTTTLITRDLSSSLRRRHAFACVSTFVARDRPFDANQSREPGTTGIFVTTGPILSSWQIGRLS